MMQMVWDNGGQIAIQPGDNWTATLESAESEKGIKDFVDYYNAGSTGPKDADESTPLQRDLFQAGRVGMMIGTVADIPAEGGAIIDPNAQIGVFAIPSATDGKTS